MPDVASHGERPGRIGDVLAPPRRRAAEGGAPLAPREADAFPMRPALLRALDGTKRAAPREWACGRGDRVYSPARGWRGMTVKEFEARILGRLGAAFPDTLAAVVAAGLAWLLARQVFGHEHPVFAAVTGILCLAPGLPNHGRQAVGLVLGVATGILVGELAFLVPENIPALRLTLASFVAMMIASSYGQQPVVAIQAGVSALLVMAMGPESAGLPRLIDVLCGTAVGLLFSQVLFTPDPVKQLVRAERGLLRALGVAFAQAEAALRSGDQARAQAALRAFSDAHGSVVALAGGIDTARSNATWTLRGRLVRRDLRFIAARLGRRSTRAYAAALLFGSALATAMQRDSGPPPEVLEPGLAAAIGLCDPDSPLPALRPLPLAGAREDWRRVLARLDEAGQAIRELRLARVADGAGEGDQP